MSLIKKLDSRPLGKDGPELPRLGLGLMSASGMYGPSPPDDERFAFLDEAYKRGEIFWDTADKYADSEDLLGKWFAANPGKREHIFLATKFGFRGHTPEGGLHIDSSPEYCRQAIEKSLSRLRLPSVDLYYVHRLDQVTPIEKTMEAMVELKKAGKIKHIGLSECSAESLRRAHAVHPVSCVQVEYSIFCTDIERNGLLQAARELGVAIVAYSPLGNGLLSGTIRKREDVTKPGDLRGILPWLREENVEKNVAIVDKISEIAKAKGITAAQLALAWVLAQGCDIFAIPGTKRVDRLEENLRSLSVPLSQAEQKLIRQLAESIVGGRVQAMFGFEFADTPPL
ncbi:hypothetical protein DTO166G4_759 [Paecilomyces variotii]|nr:hypothetical protein DTO166G4_759 [Paecilomyces variotii]KAJ9242935.1 hypothetical protein DTO166G5_39 [Paecilomyces variotii]KAJ9316283.1 hypothetical protein DTO271D3_3552 [Paecilomyces variotii]